MFNVHDDEYQKCTLFVITNSFNYTNSNTTKTVRNTEKIINTCIGGDGHPLPLLVELSKFKIMLMKVWT